MNSITQSCYGGFQKLRKYLTNKRLSNAVIALLALLISLIGYAFEAPRFEGISIKSKLAFAAYVPFLMWGIFVYLFLGRMLASKLRGANQFWSIFLLLWLIIGGWIGYMVSLVCTFILFYLATHIQYLTWIPMGMLSNEICYAAIILAVMVNGALMLTVYSEPRDSSQVSRIQ
jgi:hypothetical protein